MKTSRTVVGVDTAKRVFQLHWVDMETGEIVDLKLTRAKFLEHFANLAPCAVAMEACGGSQHWARRLRELGHEPWLLPAKAVRPFVAGNKNDAHDARAIWTAAQMLGIKTVAVKSEEQQAVLALHRKRIEGRSGAEGLHCNESRPGCDACDARVRPLHRVPGDSISPLMYSGACARIREATDIVEQGGRAPTQRLNPAQGLGGFTIRVVTLAASPAPPSS